MNNTSRLTIVRSLIVLAFLVIVIVLILPNIGEVVSKLNPPETELVRCYIGSEKSGFLGNQSVKDILAREYGLEVSATRLGSIEQSTVDISGIDCLWPSNTSAQEIFRERNEGLYTSGAAKHEIIFNSPIVLYSWAPVVDALVNAGIITEVEDYLTISTQRMIQILVVERPTWQSLNIPDLFGSINVITTDPTRSNSGNMFYGLMANMMTGGSVATLADVQEQLPIIREYYDRQGYMEESSGILFERFVSTGIGANPIIANYENALIEFALQNPESREVIREQIKMIYPTPTVYSSHPLIALTPGGRKLLDALSTDLRLQQIAWEQHGFRSGLAGVTNDPAIFDIVGIPSEIRSVMPLPRPDALLAMLEGLGG